MDRAITLLGHELDPAEEETLRSIFQSLVIEQPGPPLEVMVLSPVVLLYLRAVISIEGVALALVPQPLVGTPMRLPSGLIAVEAPWSEERLREGIRACRAQQQAPSPAASSQVSGTLLDGRFRVESCIGRGSSAVVYRAKHHLTGLTVAIKMLREEERERHAGALAALQREAEIMASVSHPNVVAILDAVLAPTGPAYLVMEHVEGETLQLAIDRDGAMPAARAFSIAAEIARGLAAAHDVGVVHGDVKPENLILARDGRVRLADFGIARWQRQLTQAPAGGTPLYLAPEVLTPGHRPDPRTDIYSLGCTVYFLITGQPPFLAEDTARIMRRHLVDPIPDLRGRIPGLDDRGAQCIKAMMAKEPDRRSRSLAQLIIQFDDLARNSP